MIVIVRYLISYPSTRDGEYSSKAYDFLHASNDGSVDENRLYLVSIYNMTSRVNCPVSSAQPPYLQRPQDRVEYTDGNQGQVIAHITTVGTNQFRDGRDILYAASAH